MEKLDINDFFGGMRLDVHILLPAIASVVGMAALWMSVFKRLLYPVMYAYYRTGSAEALAAQPIYAATLFVTAAILLAGHNQIGKALLSHRWVLALFGVAGAIGVALLSLPQPAMAQQEGGMLAGSVLVGMYLPVHLMFWALLMHSLHSNGSERTTKQVWAIVALSIGLFGIIALILQFSGAQNKWVSIACPLVSSAMAFAAPRSDWLGDPTASPTPKADSRDAAIASPAFQASVQNERAPKLEPASGAAIGSGNGAASAVDAEAAGSVRADHAPASPPSPPASIDGQRAIDPLVLQFGEDFGLSDREAELAAYTYRNDSARKIAGELFIAESTVYTHQKRIYRKTGVHSKQELIDLIDDWKAGLDDEANSVAIPAP